MKAGLLQHMAVSMLSTNLFDLNKCRYILTDDVMMRVTKVIRVIGGLIGANARAWMAEKSQKDEASNGTISYNETLENRGLQRVKRFFVRLVERGSCEKRV